MPAARTTRTTRTTRPVRAAAAAAVLPLAVSMIPAGQSGSHAAACGVYCAKERWAVKTLSDGAANQVNMTPQRATVSALVGLTAPSVGSNDRVPPLETQEYTVDAELIGYKQEGDHDFHLVVRDPQAPAETMIVEIPDPACTGVCSSLARDQITQARTTFATAFAASPPASSYVSLVTPVPVTVTGVPLWDFHHGQTGVARNCIEIHPVLSITIPTDRSLAVQSGHEPGVYPKYQCMPEVKEPPE